ncbi:hypothetical protein BSK59_12955 [Paenibacillus odorifer]|uniref:DUF7487 domain-containing protein n=1 Tax=Paenibacillus odorifer TaxID=189426 RepID=UPI00096EF217|nr:hypothetical protein [Paenibacillus odorifer]OME55383.1 hypothetical protein BSK59_12955 [Paenibacillus odorifer]
MTILTTEVLTHWNSKNKNWYLEKGYECLGKMRTPLIVLVHDLPPTSKVLVEVKCEYCNNIYKNNYGDLLVKRKNIQKDCCGNIDCMKQKRSESMLLLYGEKSVGSVEEVQKKIRKTNLKRYGVNYPMGTPEFMKKSRDSIQKKYGVNYISQVPEIRKRQMITFAKSMYSNGKCPTSSQQKYIHKIIGGELNFPLSYFNLDIKLSNIDIEYDGKGHTLPIRKFNMTPNQFKQKEIRRNEVIKSKGYKILRIVSKNDRLPYPEKILEMINFAKSRFENGRSWITFNIDDNTFQDKQGTKKFDFGKLKYIRLNNWENIYE